MFALCFWLAGCATTQLRQTSLGKKPLDFPAQIALIKKNEKWYGKKNALLKHLDLGALYHYSGVYDTAIIHLNKAVDIYDELYTKSISNEALSFLTNDNFRPYRAKPYEMIMAHSLLASSFLAQSKIDEAMVEARRAQILLDEFDKKKKKNIETYTDDPYFRFLSALSYSYGNEADNSAISLYHALKAYEKLGMNPPDMVKEAAFLQFQKTNRTEDIRTLNLESFNKNTPPNHTNQEEIVVVGYAGKGSLYGEKLFWGTYIMDGALIYHYHGDNGQVVTVSTTAPSLPASEYEKADQGRKTKSGTTLHIKFSIPRVIPQISQTKNFQTTLSDSLNKGIVYTSSIVHDLDLMAKNYLKENENTILLRTVVRVALRTIASQQTKNSLATSNPLLNLAMSLGTDFLTDQMEEADTRNWFLLPKNIQVTRIPVTPGSHVLNIKSLDFSNNVLQSKDYTVDVRKGQKKFILVSSIQ